MTGKKPPAAAAPARPPRQLTPLQEGSRSSRKGHQRPGTVPHSARKHRRPARTGSGALGSTNPAPGRLQRLKGSAL